MNVFLDTLQFLTIIPVSRIVGKQEAQLNVRPEWFPVVGLLIGLLILAADGCFRLFLPSPLSGACTIIILAFLTGGLHLDGLADTADGFFSARPRDEILRIMHDSRTGAMGVVAVASILILKVTAISSLAPEFRARAVLLMPIAGRCAMALVMAVLPPARSDGLAAALRPKKSMRLLIWPPAALLFAGLAIGGASGVIVSSISLLAVAPLSFFMWRKIGGITGDTLGAVCEVIETVSLIVGSALEG